MGLEAITDELIRALLNTKNKLVDHILKKRLSMGMNV